MPIKLPRTTIGKCFEYDEKVERNYFTNNKSLTGIF